MGGKHELSDFERDEVIGCFRWGKSVHEISVILQMPWFTIIEVIITWKGAGAITAQAKPSRLQSFQKEANGIGRKYLWNS